MKINLRKTKNSNVKGLFVKSIVLTAFFAILTFGVKAATYFSQGTNNFSVVGNWNTIAGGGGANPVAGDLTSGLHNFVIQDGHAITVNQNISVLALTIDGGGSGGSLVIGNDVTNRAIIVNGATTVTGPGNIVIGSFAASHTIDFRGNISNSGVINLFNSSSSFANSTFSTGIIGVSGVGTYTFNNFALTGTTTVNLSRSVNIRGAVNIPTGCTINDGGLTHFVGGDWIEAGTGQLTGTGTIEFNSTSSQSITAASTFNNIIVNLGGGNIFFTGPVTATGNVSVINNSTVQATANVTHTIGGNLTVGLTSLINQTTGTFVFNNAVAAQSIDVNNSTFNALTFTGGGGSFPKTLNGNLVFNGLFTINPTAQVNSTGIITSQGAGTGFRIDGTANFSGTVNFSGASAKSIITANLSSTLGTAEIISNLTGTSLSFGFAAPAVSTNFNIQNNIIANSGQIIITNNTTLTDVGGFNFDLNGTSNLFCRGANNFPTGFTNYNFAITSTVTYDGALAQNIRGGAGIIYGNLTLSNNTKTADGDLDINGSLALSANVNANLVGVNVNIQGANLTATVGCVFTNDQTVTFDAPDANQALSANPTYTFNNLVFTMDGPTTGTRTKTIGRDITVNGDFTATNLGGNSANFLIIELTTFTITNSGVGSFNLGDYVRLNTSGTNSFRNTILTFGSANLALLSKVRYNLTTNNTLQLISNNLVYGDLEINGGGGGPAYNSKAACGNLIIAGNFARVGGNAIFRDSCFNVNIGGNYELIRAQDYPNPCATSIFTFDGNTQNIGTGTGGGGNCNLPNVVFAGTGTKFFAATDNSTVNVFGNLTINDGVTVSAGNKNLTLRGDFINSGPGTAGTYTQDANRTTTLNGTLAAQNIFTNASSSFGNLTINKVSVTPANRVVNVNDDMTVLGNLTFTSNASELNAVSRTLTVGGNWAFNANSVFVGTNGTVVFNGTGGAQTINNQAPATTFNNMVFEGSSTKTLANNTFNITGNVTINSGTLNGAAIAMNVAGNWTNNGSFTHTSIVTFNGVNQIISASNFGGVTLSNAGTKTLSGNISLTGALLVNPGITLDATASNYNISVGGNYTNNGTIFNNQNTVTFTGGTKNIITGGVGVGKRFYNVVLNGTVSNNNTLTTNPIEILNDFTITSGNFVTGANDVTVGGNFSNASVYNCNGASTLTLNATSGTKVFDPGTGSTFRAITINAPSVIYNLTNNNLTISSTTNLTLTSGRLNLNGKNITMSNGNVNISPTGTLSIDANSELLLATTASLNNNGGLLRIVGTTGNRAWVRRNGAVGGFTINQSSGVLEARNYQIENSATTGFTISGGTIDATNNLSNGIFVGGSGTQYLNLNGLTFANFTVNNTEFYTGPTNNVSRTSGTGVVTFNGSTGTLAGESFDNDPGETRINWITTAKRWTGLALDNLWSTPNNWSPVGVPSPIDTVYLDHTTIPLATPYTVNITGTNANCARLVMDIQGGSGAIGLTVGSGRVLDVFENVNILTGTTLTQTDNTSIVNIGGSYVMAGTLNNGSSTINFNGPLGNYSILPGASPFFNVTVNTAGVLTLGAPITVQGALSILNGEFDVSASNHAINLAGNFTTSSPGIFTPRSGTITLNGTAQNVDGGPFFNFITAGSGTKSFVSSINIQNNITIGSGTVVSAADNIIFVGGSWTNNAVAGFTQTALGTVQFNGNATQNIDNGSQTTTFMNVITLGSGQKNILKSINVNGDFNVGSTATMDVSTFQITGTPSKSFNINGAATMILRGATNFPAGFGTVNLASNSTVRYEADIVQVVFPTIYGNLDLRRSTAVNNTKGMIGDITILGNLNINDVNTQLDATNRQITLAGNFAFPAGGRRILWGTTGTLLHNGAGWSIDVDYAGFTPDFNNLYLAGSGTKTVNANLNIGGDLLVQNVLTLNMQAFTITGQATKTFGLQGGSTLNCAIPASTGVAFPTGFTVFNLNVTSTVNINGGAISQTISTLPTYGNLTLSSNAANVATISNAAGNLIVAGNFLNSAAQLIDNNINMNFAGATVDLRNYTPTPTVTITLNGAAQNIFDGAGAVPTLNIPNIIFANTGTKTIGATNNCVISLEGTFTINPGVTVTSTNRTINFSGTTWTNNGTFSHLNTGSTNSFNYIGSNVQTINVGLTNTYEHEVVFNKTLGDVTFVTNGGFFNRNIGATPAFTINLGNTVNMGTLTHQIRGTVLNNGTWNTSTTNFVFNGGNQTFTTPTFTANNITIGGNGTKTMACPWSINDLTIDFGTTLTTSVTNHNITLTGNWTNNGGFTVNSSTVFFESNDVTPKNIFAGVSQFRDVVFNGTLTNIRTYTLTSTTTTFNRQLTINNGATLSLNGNTLNLGSNNALAEVHTVAVGGVLDVNSNANLRINNDNGTSTLNVNGRINVIGNNILPARVTRSTGNGRYQININGYAAIQYYAFDYLSDAGLNVAAAATVDPVNNFSDGTFSFINTAGGTPKYYLILNGTVTTAIQNVTFNFLGTPIVGVHFNVQRTTGAFVQFNETISGTMGSFTYESDDNSATTGLLRWPLTIDITWTGAINTNWNLAGNWSPAQIPTLVDNAIIPLVVNNPRITTANAACKNLTITTGNLALENGFDLVVDRDVTLGTGVSNGIMQVLNPSSEIEVRGSWFRGTNGFFAAGGGTVNFTGNSGVFTIAPFTPAFFNVNFNGPNSTFTITSPVINFDGSMNILDGSVNPTSAGYTINIKGNHLNTGTFNTGVAGTVVFNGTGSQSITNGTFSSVTFSGSSTKTIFNNLVVLGTTTVNSGATLASNVSGLMDFRGNVNMVSGSTFNDGGNLHIFSGAIWTGANTSTLNTGGVRFTRSGAQSLVGGRFNSLVFEGSGNKTLAANVDIGGDVTVKTGTGFLNLQTFTINSINSLGVFTLEPNTALYVRGLNNYPNNYTSYDFDITSDAYYDAAIDQNIGGIAYGNLILNTLTVKTLAENTIVKGNLNFNNSTLDVSSNDYTLFIGRNYNNNSTGSFICRNGEVIFNGTGVATQFVYNGAVGTKTFNNVTINKTPGLLLQFNNNNPALNGDLRVQSGILDINGNNVSVGANLQVSASGLIQTSGTFTLNNSTSSTNSIESNGSVLNNITINAPGSSYVLLDDFNINGNFQFLAGTFDGNGKNANLGNGSEAININGTYIIGAGGKLGLGNNTTCTVAGSLVAVGTSGDVARISNNNSGGRYTFIVTGNISAQNYLFEYMSTAGIQINSTATVDAINNFSNGTFTNGAANGTYLKIENTQTITAENVAFATNPGGSAKNVSKTIASSGVVTFNNFLGVFAGPTFEQDAFGLIDWTGPIVLTWNGSVNSDWYNATNWTPSSGGPAIPSALYDVVIATAVNQPIINLDGAATNKLTLNLGTTLTVSTPFASAPDFLIGSDLVLNGTLISTGLSDTINVTGNWTKSASGNFIPGNSTVIFDANSGTKTINNGTSQFNNLQVDGLALFQLGANTVATGFVKINSGTFDVTATNYSLTVRGDWTCLGNLNPRNATVTLNSLNSNPRSINNGTSNFNNLVITAPAGAVYSVVSNNLRVNGNTVVNSGTLNVNNFTFDNGDNSGFDALTIFGTFDLGNNGTLRNGSNASVIVNTGGVFRSVGLDANTTANVTRISTGFYNFTVNAGATINAKFYQYSFLNSGGLQIKAGATINATNNFSDGSFTNGAPGGKYLLIENDFADFIAANVNFNVGPTTNVSRLTGTGIITFLDAQGLLAGEDYEEDDFGAGTGNVRWTFTDPLYSWTGAISTDWNTPGNWNDEFGNPAAIVPDGTTIARINDVSGGSGNFPLISLADATCSDLIVKPNATLTFANNRALTANGSVTNGGTITVGASSTSNITVADLWANAATFNAGASTVIMTAPSGFKALTPGASSFNNLSLTGAATFQTTSSLVMIGGLTIANGTLVVTNPLHQITLGGDWNNSGTFTNGNGLVLFNKVSGTQTITNGSGETFHSLSMSNTGAITKVVQLNSNINVNGNLNILSVRTQLNGGANTINLRGSWTNSGLAFSSTGTVNLIGTSNQTVQRINVAPETFNNLTLNNASNGQLLSNVNFSGNLTLTAGTLSCTNKILNVTGSLSGAGGLNFTSGTINLSGANTHTGTYTKGTSLFNYNGTGAQTIRAVDYHNLTSSSSGVRTLPALGIIRVSNVFTPGTNSYAITNSTVEFNGSVSQTIPAFNYFNLSSTNIGARILSPSGTIGIAGNFAPGTNSYTVALSTVNFNGTAPQTCSAFTFNNLSKSGASTLDLTGAITVNGTTFITNGTLNSNQFQITGNISFGFTMSAGTTLSLGSLSSANNILFPTNYPNSLISLACNSTVIYQSNGDQTISSVPAYGNLQINSVASANKNISGTTSICGNLSGASSAATMVVGANTINLTGNYSGTSNISFTSGTLNIAGNWTNSGTFASGTGLVNYNGAGSQTIGAATYYNLTSSNTGARTLASAGTIFIGNVFTPGTNVYTVTGSTVEFNSAGSQTIPAFNYNNLISSNTGARTLASSGIVGVAGNFVPSTNVYTITGSTVEFNGSGAQSAGAFIFNNLNVNKSGGTVSITGAQQLNNTMTITSGNYNTTGGSLTFNSTASTTARLAPVVSGGITGNIIMRRFIPGGQTGWAFLGTPVSGATIADWTSPWPVSGFPTSGFTGSTGSAGGSFISIYWYDETAPGGLSQGYMPATNVTNSLVNGRGYWVYLGTGAVTTADINIQTNGTPFIGVKDLGVTYTTSGGGVNADGWNLVANPYPSAIDWDSPSWFKSNLENAVYVWNADAAAMATYIGGVGVNGGSRFIASSQAFQVKATTTSPSLIASENVKVANQPTFLRQNSVSNENETLLRISLSKPGTTRSDETVIRFNENAIEGFNENLEASKYYSFIEDAVNIATLRGTNEFTISALSTLENSTEIPVKVKVQPNGTYTLNFAGLSELESAFPTAFASDYLVIVDNENGQEVALSSSNPFVFNTGSSQSVKEFTIKFHNALITNVKASATSHEVSIATDGNGVFANFNLAENKEVNISMVNTLGQEIISNETVSVKNGKHYLTVPAGLSQGIYLVNVRFDNKTVSAKVKL
jgi:hypothetical protein